MSYYSTLILNESPPPQAYWRMDATSGTSQTDATGNGYAGSLSSGITYSQTGAITGDSDTSLEFTGLATFAFPSTLWSTMLAWTALSIECWIKQTGLWEHVVIVATTSTITYYLDGQVYTSGAGDPVLVAQDFSFVGSYNSGNLDEIAVYNYALSPTQIQHHFLVGQLIQSGGFGCWANGTGTASFDHFRATQYPDPALSLASVLPRLGNTTVAWDENIPTNASRTIKTSLDGVTWTDVTSSNGGSIPGLNGQPDPTIDYFNTNTSANYTNTAKSGGSAATVTYDTANSRIILSGGSGGLYLYTAISDNDVDLIADMDESDAGGLVWRYVDGSNYYELGAYDDSSSGGFTNQLRLYKVVSGTRSLIGSASTITWPRSTPGTSPYKRIRVTMLGTTITVYFDGATMQTATDSTFASGKMGLRNDGGTSRYYQLRLQPVGDYVSGTPTGDIVTGDFVYTQVTLTTTDPTANPQIQDLTTTANSPSVANGAIISQLHDPTKPFAAFYNNEMDSLVSSSGDYYWALNSNALTFAKRQATPAPWILHSSDLLFTPRVKPTFSADLYRNRQTITNCLGTVNITGEQKVADGTATSWQMAYPLYGAPTITVQGIAKTVGVQGVDTGKDFYWQAASNSISQDASATAIPKGSIISVNYVGQFTTNVTRDNLPEQAARQAVEGGTGIVEAIEDGKQKLVSEAQTYGDGLLARFSNNNTVEIQVTTRRSGLVKGQALPVFLPEHGINNAQLLITKIVTIGEQLADGTILYQFQITATDGPSLTRWASALGL